MNTVSNFARGCLVGLVFGGPVGRDPAHRVEGAMTAIDPRLAPLAAALDKHWLFRTEDGVFHCTADDWTLDPDVEIAEGDRVYPFTQHIAAAILAERGVFLPDGLPESGKVFGWTCPECGTPVETFVRLAGDAATIATLRAENERLQESFVRQRDCDHSPCVDEADRLHASLDGLVEAGEAYFGAEAGAPGWEERYDALAAAVAAAKEATDD
jgi:hypothetical protein